MEKVARTVSLHDPPSDAAYWRKQSPADRLAALEQLRREYHDWPDDTQPRLPRVYSVAKRE